MGRDLVPHAFDTGAGTVRWGAWGDGPPMVLVHGSPFSSAEWRDVLPGLVDTHRVFVWDLLGFGRSEMSAEHDVSLAHQARVFAALLEHWGLDAPSVVAHDVGGLVTLRALLLEGARYGELTLANAVGVRNWSGGAFFDTVSSHAEVFAALPAHAHRALAASKIVDASHRGLTPSVLEELLAPWTGDQGQAAFYRQYGSQDAEADTVEIESRLADIDVPVRILWGREDTWLPPAYAQRMREAIPHTRFAWIDDAGHLVAHDAPAALVAHLRAPVPRSAA